MYIKKTQWSKIQVRRFSNCYCELHFYDLLPRVTAVTNGIIVANKYRSMSLSAIHALTQIF